MYYYSNLSGVGFSLNPIKLIGKAVKGVVSLVRGNTVQAGPVTVSPTAPYMPPDMTPASVIPGVPNNALLVAGGLLGAMALMAAMSRRPRRNPSRRRRRRR